MSKVSRVENSENSRSSPSTTLEDAAELIQSLDNAFAEMSTNAVSAVVDAEDARRNANAATAFAKVYSPMDYRKHQLSENEDSIEFVGSNTNGHSNYDDASTGISSIDHELPSYDGNNSTMMIEKYSNGQNGTFHKDGCHLEGNEEMGKNGKDVKIGNVPDGKHDSAQYHNGTAVMDDKIDYCNKRGGSNRDTELEGERCAAQCQNATVNMDTCNREGRITEKVGSKENGVGQYESNLDIMNGFHEVETNKSGYYSKDKNGLIGKYEDKNSCNVDTVDTIDSPIKILPLVDFVPSTPQNSISIGSSAHLMGMSDQDHSETLPTEVLCADVVSNDSDHQQNRSSHPLPTTIFSQQKSITSIPSGKSENGDVNDIQREVIPRGKAKKLRWNVKSYQDEEVTRYSNGQLSSSEIAQSHAEDVLTLSLDLECMKEKLKTETDSNAKIRSDLDKEKEKACCQSATIQKKNDEINELKADLLQAQYRVKAAEEDAEEALRIAKKGASDRKEIEGLLKNALNEIEKLRLNAHSTNDRDGNNDEDKLSQGTRLPVITEEVVVLKHNERQSNQCTAIVASPSLQKDTSRAIISVGRGLLRKSACNKEDESSESSQDSSTSIGSRWIDLKRKTADKRRKLRERLKHSGTNDHSITGRELVCYSPKSSHSDEAKSANIICRNVATIVRKSGKALKLGGRWFSSRQGRSREEDVLEAEPMTAHYCKSVEGLISRYQKEYKELEAFNRYLEGQIAKT